MHRLALSLWASVVLPLGALPLCGCGQESAPQTRKLAAPSSALPPETLGAKALPPRSITTDSKLVAIGYPAPVVIEPATPPGSSTTPSPANDDTKPAPATKPATTKEQKAAPVARIATGSELRVAPAPPADQPSPPPVTASGQPLLKVPVDGSQIKLRITATGSPAVDSQADKKPATGTQRPKVVVSDNSIGAGGTPQSSPIAPAKQPESSPSSQSAAAGQTAEVPNRATVSAGMPALRGNGVATASPNADPARPITKRMVVPQGPIAESKPAQSKDSNVLRDVKPKVAKSPAASAPDAKLQRTAPTVAGTKSSPTNVAPHEFPVEKPLTAEPCPDYQPVPFAHSRERTSEMRAVLSRADEHIRHGVGLAQRGALYSARIEFLQALRSITEALDTQHHTTVYSDALNNGLTALRESRDLIGDATSERPIDVAFVTASHRTPVLKDGTAHNMPSVLALQRYYTYAQEQLAAATGQEPSGSIVLFALGRVSMIMPTPSKTVVAESIAHAMVYHQAALLADPNNYRAANELGVLMARSGRLERSRTLFLQVLTIAPSSQVWYNLAVVHDRLGEKDAAEYARRQGSLIVQNEKRSDLPPVEWLDTESFARTKSSSEDMLPPTNVEPASHSTVQKNPTPEPPKKRTGQWLPWSKPALR